MHLVPDPAVHGHFNVLRGYVRARRSISPASRSIGDYVDNYQHGLPSEFGLLYLFDPRNRRADGDHRRAATHRHAHRRRHRDRREASGAQGLAGARPCRRARHRLLERAPARPSVRLRRDPRPFAPAGKPRRLRRAAGARSRQAGASRPRTGESCVEGADIVVEASRLDAARSRCSRPRGSSRARWSCPTAR